MFWPNHQNPEVFRSDFSPAKEELRAEKQQREKSTHAVIVLSSESVSQVQVPSADTKENVVVLLCLCVVIFAGRSGSLCVCVAGYIVLRCKLRFNLPVAEYYAAAKPLIGPTS